MGAPSTAVPSMPDAPPGHVHRQRLISQLDAGARTPLTLVSAPAGWGKTTLLVSWARAALRFHPVAWLTVDAPGPVRLLARLTEALVGEPVARGVGDEGDEVIRHLFAAVDAMDSPPVVIVDGLHRVRDPVTMAEIEQLVRYGGGRLRLLLASRVDPDLPVHRWRVSGVLTEVRTADLAFSVDETAQLLEAHGIGLTESALFELHALTGGWAAGLRLAALSLRGRTEPERGLTDDRGYLSAVAEYLIGEVVDPLPEDLRELLLVTSTCSGLTAGLVEALTQRGDGVRAIAELSDANLFLTQGRGLGGWYRYHPLLVRTLYEELQRQYPDRVPELHRRAANWHAAHGLPGDAVRHALVAGQWPQAVELLDAHWMDLAAGVRRRSLYEVAATPPGPELEPRLALAFAADRLADGDPDGARGFLRATDRQQRTADDPDLGTMAAAFHLSEASLFGDPARALGLAPEFRASTLHGASPGPGADDDEARALAALSMGRAQMRLGQWETARPLLRDALGGARQAGLVQVQVGAAGQLALLHAVQGRLREAAQVSRQALAMADRCGLGDAGDLGWARLAMAEVYYQWDRLTEAGRLVDEAVDLANGDPTMFVFAELVRARLRFAHGDITSALQIVLAARHEFAGCAGPYFSALSLTEAELRLAAGDLGTAGRLVSEQAGFEPLAEWASVVEAAILLGEGKPAAAASTAARAMAGGASSSLTWTVKAAVLSALACRALGDRERVARSLDIALAVAENEGFRRPFSAGGHAVRDLLARFAPMLPAYYPIAADLAVDPHEPTTRLVTDLAAATRGSFGQVVEPLTERELTVLRFLQGTMSTVEIASALYVSVNTVKTHIKNIYRKLSTGRRREAVERARELRLL